MTPFATARSERGAALLTVMLLLMIMSGVVTALAVSGRTEFAIARNHGSEAQALAAAEAGLNHAVEVAITNLRLWQANGFPTASAAMSRLLRGPDDLSGSALTDADNGSLETMGIPRPPARLALAGAAGAFYEARLFDDDDPGRGVTLNAADQARVGENGATPADANTRIVVRAIGYAQDGTSTVLEAMIGPLTGPAVLTNGSLTISADPSGEPEIEGDNGSVHSNANLTISGEVEVEGDATASGTYTASPDAQIDGQSGGGRPVIPVPSVRAIDYRPKADFVLTSGGQMTTLAGVVVCDASVVPNACALLGHGWVFNGAAGWGVPGATATSATYYVEGKATISGSLEASITIIAEGSIEVTGDAELRPKTPELLFVTDGDLRIVVDDVDVEDDIEEGTDTDDVELKGLILVREQLQLTGDVEIEGQIVVEDAASTSGLVTANIINGEVEIENEGTGIPIGLTVRAWRQAQ